ncbi:ROK family protein [Bacillus altitudinis]|uniref:ROK family protein n=1 Tax=Bacillus altitudinis TaxID=293387 RepID=UPI000933B740|nr:ROK family protein [Bacillus altitudinis]OJT61853.1 hypothetical protein BFP48_08120 [Bacillus altitudinis]
MSHFVVIDIGGTTIKHSLMTRDAEMKKSGETLTPEQGMGKTFQEIEEIVASYRNETEIEGLALSIPGAVDIESGYVHFAGAVTDLMHQNVKETFKHLGLRVELENDVNCVTLAEKWKGHAKACQHFVCITVGTGIGGGIFLNGDLHRGSIGMAGEFGLMTLSYGEQLHEAINEYSFSNLASTRSIVEKAEAQIGEVMSGQEIFQRAAEGCVHALRLLNSFYDALSIGICNIVHALAPEKLLIGGGISARTEVLREVKDRMKRIRKETLDITEVDLCALGNDAGKVGALFHFLRAGEKEGRAE